MVTKPAELQDTLYHRLIEQLRDPNHNDPELSELLVRFAVNGYTAVLVRRADLHRLPTDDHGVSACLCLQVLRSTQVRFVDLLVIQHHYLC